MRYVDLVAATAVVGMKDFDKYDKYQISWCALTRPVQAHIAIGPPGNCLQKCL